MAISLQQAIDYSTANPNTDYARNIGTSIKSGAFDQVAAQQGVDLTRFGRPAAPANSSTIGNTQSPKYVGAEVAQNYANQLQPATADIMGGGNIGKSVSDFSKGNIAGGVEKAALGVPADAVQAIFAPLTAPIQTLLSHTATHNAASPSPTANVVNTPEAQAARKALSDWAQAHPDLAQTLSDAFTVGAGVAGGGETSPLTKSISEVKTGVKSAVSDLTGLVKETPKEGVAVAPSADVGKTIDAVNPELKGQKLAGAYKQVVTGQRSVTPAGIMKEQTLSPSQQAINIGTRLHDAGIVLSDNPVKDLNTLKGAMDTTESRITELLKGNDPEIVYNADKPTLLKSLEDIKSTTPREFATIKDSKTIHDNVINFAKEIVGKADDTVTGIRNARIAFDTQARTEYPNAFKNGVVDTKTPAGRAIKAARDTINEHLYNTAPAGSEIKTLIQREADIYRATENIAPKAAATHGTTKIDQSINWLRQHPVIEGVAGYEAIKHLVPGGQNLPGI